MFEEKSFPFNLLDKLTCPCCCSRFEIGLEVKSSQEGLNDGILRCDCYEYPVISGIAVLRQMGPVSSTQNKAVDYLKQRDSNGALLWLLGNGSAAGVPGLADISSQTARRVRLVRRVRDLFRNRNAPLHDGPIPLQSGLRAALQATRSRGYADYLFHRFANPSLLGALSPLVILGEGCRNKSTGRVLDLLCGVGHTSTLLSELWPELEIVGADSDFVNLFLAQFFLAPKVAAICLDAEIPLPFTDSSFDGVFCLDGLHYARSKVALLREVDRILSADGIWAFAHMHNATGNNECPGTPLLAEGYATRFGFGQHRLMSELEVLHQYQTDGCLDLTSQADIKPLESSHALTLIGSRTAALWKRHSKLDEALCRRPELLGFNPIYKVEEHKDGLILRTAWPSEALQQECIGGMPIIPEMVRIPSHVVDQIEVFRRKGTLSDEVRKLLRSFILVSLPACYPRPSLPHQGVIGNRN